MGTSQNLGSRPTVTVLERIQVDEKGRENGVASITVASTLCNTRGISTIAARSARTRGTKTLT